MEEEEIEEYNQYGDWNSHLEVEIEHQDPKKQPLHGGDIKDFVQSVNNHRAFVSRGDIVNLYKYDDDIENFAYVRIYHNLSIGVRSLCRLKFSSKSRIQRFPLSTQNTKTRYIITMSKRVK